ncbi:Aspartyl/glutamyl-tRNA(Asn/Gln) amidotransferase subunit B [Candidatus Tiddalikarchaeum anstoanum]|nr:Aspartyl/glutamyl-tRNA(Asn/Gln) amidotransferase subunit B [Candidatus Tiddalikarchaeum anstoanum]
MTDDIKCIIGLEIHTQMKTKSKIFCSCPVTESEPNTNVCPICLGYPGTKPMLNKKVLENGVKIAKALNCNIPQHVFFSRKSYFYPDMTKNFQITQYEIPIGLNGNLSIPWEGKSIKIRIKRAHIEEDPGRLEHVGGDITNSKYTLVDYNRAGIPLIEIVTEPDFTNPEQAGVFLKKLRAILEHLDVYDSDMIMKADANISIQGGARVEVKNITGFHNIMKALEYEYNRQRIMAKQGNFVKLQETRAYSEGSKTTKQLRLKESEADYGYIFEPDLSWQNMNTDRLSIIFKTMNELPDERIERFRKEYNLTPEISTVLIYTDKALADFFETCAKKVKDKVLLANWVTTHLLKCLNYNDVSISKSKLSPENFSKFVIMLENGELNERLGKELIKELVSTGKDVKKLMSEKNISVISDADIESGIVEVLKKNEKAVVDYKAGKVESFTFLLGEVLKKIKYQADVQKVKNLLEKKL